ncbi:MAG TPA: ThiF family adenylyltransferase, partial [Thermoanaerobaculia bacterium]|nr:ThiF family adenylyltransferase [Thermoanaerobaculia bacterium]
MSFDDRFSRSILFPGIGKEGQERIASFSIVFVGIGAVGAAAAESAARAGIGRL